MISTVPIPYISKMIPDLPASARAAYQKFLNIGVACLIFKLKRSVTPHFWVNVTDVVWESLQGLLRRCQPEVNQIGAEVL
ncbi:MAG TPA: hypothetical protein VMM15_34045, partial [Bradyrhizobium sp.]|nr:hypothetical protein [Bradyrhizobium sp.]